MLQDWMYIILTSSPESGAGKTYEFQVDGEVAEYTYTAEEGDAIPNGDMSKWSDNSRGVTAPNAEGESFWDSGQQYINYNIWWRKFM